MRLLLLLAPSSETVLLLNLSHPRRVYCQVQIQLYAASLLAHVDSQQDELMQDLQDVLQPPLYGSNCEGS
jgi:hypothetical protein